MKTRAKMRVPAAILVLAVIVAVAIWLLWKVAVLDAPPRADVIIDTAASAAGPTQRPAPSYSAAATARAGSAPLQVATVTKSPSGAAASPTAAETAVPTSTPEPIIVYVSGAVKSPGLYTLTVGSRVGDAIALAGGFADQADPDAINLASRLADEEHVIAPRRGETPTAALARTPTTPPAGVPRSSPRAVSTPRPTPPSTQAVVPSGKVNINTASAAELETLPGIGPVLAARIASFREANGPFAVPEDLMKVPGIKDALFAKVKDYITTGQ